MVAGLMKAKRSLEVGSPSAAISQGSRVSQENMRKLIIALEWRLFPNRELAGGNGPLLEDEYRLGARSQEIGCECFSSDGSGCRLTNTSRAAHLQSQPEWVMIVAQVLLLPNQNT